MNGMDDEEPVFLPLNAPGIRTIEMANDNNGNQVIEIRDYLYLAYATLFPMLVRRIVEFVFLLMAVLSFFVLVFVHMKYSKTPANCLDHVKGIWPRNGILRVEIIRSYQRALAEQTGTLDKLFTLEKSYEREYQFKKLKESGKKLPVFLNPSTKINYPENNEKFDSEPLSEDLVGNKYKETNEKKEIFSSSTRKPNRDKTKSNLSQTEVTAQFCSTKYLNNSIERMSEIRINSLLPCTNLTPSPTKKYKDMFHENYIVEYSLEYGFLRLSPNIRSRFGIPVMLVVLEPTRSKCFGSSIDQFFLDYIIGYEDLLMSSIKSLNYNEQNKGYLRNVITGVTHTFRDVFMSMELYFTSFCIMVIVTSSISMLVRYLYHRINVFMGHFLQLAEIDFQGLLSFVATSILAFILAMIGMRIGVSEFFNDDTTACYVVLIVLVAYHYYALCSHCPITKKHWIKFFFLYHFSFYAYHNRFYGQYRYLALVSSCFFILHSMIYFFHHYELPYVLQQVQPQQVIIEREHQDQPFDSGVGEDARQPDAENPVEVNLRPM